MPRLTFTAAFAKYGAKLPNRMWAVSAIAPDGSLVISCWQHLFSSPEKGVLRYTDRLSRWKGNAAGNNLLHAHLTKAQEEGLPVRLVIVSTTNTDAVEAGEDASQLDN
jgi:putative restriction endonuclease